MSAGRADVAVIGAGPAGLAAATALRRAGAGTVVVLDREAQPGGVPRHCHHQGYGLRDLRRVLSGPQYAARWARTASGAGAELRLSTQVTGWTADGALEVTGPQGRGELAATAVVLATGCRERPRAARLVAGSRPQGVMTTGMLQQLVYLEGGRVGSRAVVIGAEHVSFSALMTLHHGGARAVAMTTELDRHQSFTAFRAGAAARFRTPLHTRTALTAIRGGRRVEAVEITHLDSGATRSWNATSSSSRPGGSPTMSWPSWATPRWTGARAGRSSTPPCGRPGPGCSPRATCCTAPRPLTSRRSVGGTSRPPCSSTWAAGRGRRPAFRSGLRTRSTGSSPTP